MSLILSGSEVGSGDGYSEWLEEDQGWLCDLRLGLRSPRRGLLLWHVAEFPFYHL